MGVDYKHFVDSVHIHFIVVMFIKIFILSFIIAALEWITPAIADVQVRTIPCRDCLVQRNVFEEKYKPYFRNVNPTSITTKFQSRSDSNPTSSFSSYQPSLKHSSLEPLNSHFGSKTSTELYADDQFSSFNETQSYYSNMNMTKSEE